jgi:hypothetical protein
MTATPASSCSTATAQVNAGCWAVYGGGVELWRCFFANETYPYIKTPVFLTQSFHGAARLVTESEADEGSFSMTTRRHRRSH